MHMVCCYQLCIGVLSPTNVSATVLSSRSIQITWSPSKSDSVTSYLITYSTTDRFTSSKNVTVNDGSTTSHTLIDLEEGTFYTVTVQAIDSDNGMSANSNEVTIMTFTASK